MPAGSFSQGGKADMLLRLRDKGFRVPEFEIAPDSADDLQDAVERLGFPLAVRSSANLEDGRAISFAGQFQSQLNLRRLEDVQRAVEECRRAIAAPGVRDYCRRMQVDPDQLRMHVILQRMVQPQLAGVAFGVHPATGEDVVVIEACEGLADRLLAGSEPPLPQDHPLLQRHRPTITALVHRVQTLLGRPQDIEFALEGEELYLLQSRPVTRIQFPPDIGEWTNADFRDGGVSAEACSPLMASLYQSVWDQSLKQCLRELKLFRRDFPASRIFFARPYWNLGAVKEAVALIPGFVERDFDEDLSVEIRYQGQGRTTPVHVKTLVRAIPTVLALPGFFRRRQREAESLLAEFPWREQEVESALEQLDWEALIRRHYFPVELCYFRTIYALSLAKLDFQDAFPEASYPRLAAALPELRHMAPLREARRLRDPSPNEILELVRRYRHHCRFGVDIRHPRWDEDLEFAVRMLADAPRSRGYDPRPEYLDYRRERRERLPWRRRRKFDRKLDRLRRLVWLREELRDVSNRMYYLIRRKALQLGRLRELGEQVFFQTWEEVAADRRDRIDERRRIFATYRDFPAPNEIFGAIGSPAAPVAGSSAEEAPSWRGIGASGGVAQGPVCVARSVEEAMLARPGDILVCPFTEPGWTPVLDRVAAVVTETGGQLSHAAVICREYGIPAVLGVADATRRIPPGAVCRVDGYQGVVTRL